jgi:hypothetical protein
MADEQPESTDLAMFIGVETIADVRRMRPSRIYYAMHTCWWAYSEFHLYSLPGSSVEPGGKGLPCDPRGSVLMMSEEGDAEGFVLAAQANPEHYGKHGFRAFEAALHGNVVVAATGKPTSFRTWAAYNELLDRYDAQQQDKEGS